jgi:hypothetical protein
MAGLVGATVTAQTLRPGYTPLFTPEQIRNASDATRQRMIDTERDHREAWMQRNPGARRSAAEPGDPPSNPTGEGEREPPASADAAPRAAPPGKRKIYRWVDSQGRVNFGDRPASTGATEVRIRNDGASRGSPRARRVGAED